MEKSYSVAEFYLIYDFDKYPWFRDGETYVRSLEYIRKCVPDNENRYNNLYAKYTEDNICYIIREHNESNLDDSMEPIGLYTIDYQKYKPVCCPYHLDENGIAIPLNTGIDPVDADPNTTYYLQYVAVEKLWY